jgi:hypothetical protein
VKPAVKPENRARCVDKVLTQALRSDSTAQNLNTGRRRWRTINLNRSEFSETP